MNKKIIAKRTSYIKSSMIIFWLFTLLQFGIIISYLTTKSHIPAAFYVTAAILLAAALYSTVLLIKIPLNLIEFGDGKIIFHLSRSNRIEVAPAEIIEMHQQNHHAISRNGSSGKLYVKLENESFQLWWVSAVDTARRTIEALKTNNGKDIDPLTYINYDLEFDLNHDYIASDNSEPNIEEEYDIDDIIDLNKERSDNSTQEEYNLKNYYDNVYYVDDNISETKYKIPDNSDRECTEDSDNDNNAF